MCGVARMFDKNIVLVKLKLQMVAIAEWRVMAVETGRLVDGLELFFVRGDCMSEILLG